MTDAIEEAEVLLDQGQITSSHEILTNEIIRLSTYLKLSVGLNTFLGVALVLVSIRLILATMR